MNAKLKNTALQLARQMECARAAGIYEHTFLSFGGLLGFVREQGFIEGDNDLDVGVFADNITAEQEREFVRLLGMPTTDFPTSKGLFEYRERSTRREDNGRYWWVSIRGKSEEECFKCCHWFFWKQYGYMWHTKGPGSFLKGAPAFYLSPGPEVEFMGVKIHIPKMVGSILDFWYTDWWTKRLGGNSAKKVTMEVTRWGAPRLQGKVIEKDVG